MIADLTPTNLKDISWIPAEAAAQAVVELRRSTAPVLHLANPHPVPWSKISEQLSKTLDLPIIPYFDWLDLLEKSGANLNAKSEVEALRVNPALRILEFFRSEKHEKSPKSTEALGPPLLDITRAQKDSLSLGTIAPIGSDAVAAWLAYWKRVEYL